MKRLVLKVMCAGIILAGSAVVRADTLLYQNTATNLSYRLYLLPTGQTIGQQVWLGTGAQPYSLTSFFFDYYSPNASWSAAKCDVSFYLNDGVSVNGYKAPGTKFFDSGTFSINSPLFYTPSTNVIGWGLNSVDFQNGDGPGALTMSPDYVMPSNFTFTVTFTGLQGAETVGLPLYELPQVGMNAGDYWYDVSGNWELLTNSYGLVGLGAQFTGTPQPIPEPSVVCLSALGGAVFAFIARRRQRRG